MTPLRVTGIVLRALPALIWAIAAHSAWRFLLSVRPRNRFYVLFALLATVVAADFTLSTFFWVLPLHVSGPPPMTIACLYLATDVLTIVGLALLRHMLRYVPLRDERPSRAWLAVNYGLAALVAGAALAWALPLGTFGSRLAIYRIVFLSYEIVMLALGLKDVLRTSRGGRWRAGGGMLVLRHADVALVAAGGLGIGGILWLVASGSQSPPIVWLTFDVLIGLALSTPIAVRFLGEVVRAAVIIAVVVVAVVVAAWLVAIADSRIGVPASALWPIGAGVLVLAFWLAQPSLRAAVDRLVFRRSRQRRASLQAFFFTLSPDLGSGECSRRALSELVRVMQLRGAALVLRSGEISAAGDIAIEPLRAAWSAAQAAGRLPTYALGDYALTDMPIAVRELLSDVDVTGTTSVRSPRRDWGHLFVSAGLLRSHLPDEDAQTVQGFADQLALVLDGAELLERAIAVERSLAHAEKLAAIGELAARVAHDIRNPITAARSLAQLLLRAPASRGDAEAAELILTELGRVERRVAELLRFARRDELRLADVDLGVLTRETVDRFRPRLDAAAVALALDVPPGIVVRADREMVLHGLVNLIENALDALGEQDGERRLELALRAGDGQASLRVADNGPGVDPDALARIFEPFFSMKSHGTGLGLAIVKRTIEAHGGTVAAEAANGSGFAVRIDLPLSRGGGRPEPLA